MGFYQLTTETIAVVKLKAKQQAARIMFVPNNGIDKQLFNDNQVKLPSFMFYNSCFWRVWMSKSAINGWGVKETSFGN